jgi:glycine cleavage system H protein
VNINENLLYTKDHEWLRAEEGKGYIGISDYAQHHLGDIVYIELPMVGDSATQGEPIGVVESVKAVSSIYSPVSGSIIEVNQDLEEAPELLNQDPYENWIAVIEISDNSELENLMDASEYAAYCETLED